MIKGAWRTERNLLDEDNIRGLVKSYIAEHSISQKQFGEDLGLSKYSFRRFMASGKETSGKGSDCFPVLHGFFMLQRHGGVDITAKRALERSPTPTQARNEARNQARGEEREPSQKKAKTAAGDESPTSSTTGAAPVDTSNTDASGRLFKTSARKRLANQLYKQTQAYKDKQMEKRRLEKLNRENSGL
jgi:hypothetical protein